MRVRWAVRARNPRSGSTSELRARRARISIVSGQAVIRPLRRSPYRICGKQKATGQDRAARSQANPLESRSFVQKLKHQAPLAGLPDAARNLEQSYWQPRSAPSPGWARHAHPAMHRAANGAKFNSRMPSLYSKIPAKLRVSNCSAVKRNYLPQSRYSHPCGNAYSRNQTISNA